MGFPFFMPAYLPGNHVTILRLPRHAGGAFRRRNRAPPFRWTSRGWKRGSSSCASSPSATTTSRGLRVRAKRQHHGGDSYGYRIEHRGKVVVYSRFRAQQDDPQEVAAFVEFFRDAYLVIFDAQYSLADAISVKRMGHSEQRGGRGDVPARASPPPLSLSLTQPMFDDERIARLLAETRRLEEITRTDHRVEVWPLRTAGAGALRRRPERRTARPTARGSSPRGRSGSGPARSGRARPNRPGALLLAALLLGFCCPAAGAPVAARDRVRTYQAPPAPCRA